MSPRPPTLRENRRYILVRVEPAGTVIDQKRSVLRHLGCGYLALGRCDGSGIITQAVVAAEGRVCHHPVPRGTERELAIALSTVTGCRDLALALRIVAASGTIESLRETDSGTEVPPDSGPV